MLSRLRGSSRNIKLNAKYYALLSAINILLNVALERLISSLKIRYYSNGRLTSLPLWGIGPLHEGGHLRRRGFHLKGTASSVRYLKVCK